MFSTTIQTLTYSPGQQATIFLQTVDGYGNLANSPTTPTVNRIVFPNLTLASGFPQNMVPLDTGLYYFLFTLPINASAIGSYLVDVSFTDVVFGATQHSLYHIIVNAPFGNYSVSTF